MAHRLAWLSLCLFGTVLPGAAPARACDLPPGERAEVSSVIDGETLALADGRIVRLLGVKAPAAPLNWRGDDPWPFVAEAKAGLARRVPPGTSIELRFDARREDRYGHLLAQVFVVKDGTPRWLQADLVGDGLARVYSLADASACVPELLVREAEARAGRRGLWRSWAYRVQDASDVKRLGRLTYSYQLVEGTVQAVGEGRSWLYLNFAADWRTDFTIAIARKDLAAFEAAGLDLESLPGKPVRVRGVVEWWNGPAIKATHPQQIEVLPPPPSL